MTPVDKNVLDAVHLLVLLLRSRKQVIPKLSVEEQHTLKITEDHLAQAGLTIPVFINTLHLLHEKGYLMAVSVYEKESHEKIRKGFSDESYAEILKALDDHQLGELTLEQKESIAQGFEKLLPPNFEIDREVMAADKVSFKDLIDVTRNIMTGHKDTDISTVIIMPFRDIERLLEKLNNGTSFKDIQDEGLWYDPSKRCLHVGEKTYVTMYQGEPTKVHFLLQKLFETNDETVVDYSDAEEYDTKNSPQSENKKYYLSLNNFLNKHPELNDIFTAQSDRLEIHGPYLSNMN